MLKFSQIHFSLRGCVAVMWCTHYTWQFCFYVCLPVRSLCLMSQCMCHWNEIMFSSYLYFFSSFFLSFFFFLFLSGNQVNIQKPVWSVVDLTIAIHPIGNKTSNHHSCCGSKVKKKINPFIQGYDISVYNQWPSIWKLICLIQLLAWRSKEFCICPCPLDALLLIIFFA